eukprot:scaffold16535_cov16-Prasinocladus_malaysianus.AAC.1
MGMGNASGVQQPVMFVAEHSAIAHQVLNNMASSDDEADERPPTATTAPCGAATAPLVPGTCAMSSR